MITVSGPVSEREGGNDLVMVLTIPDARDNSATPTLKSLPLRSNKSPSMGTARTGQDVALSLYPSAEASLVPWNDSL